MKKEGISFGICPSESEDEFDSPTREHESDGCSTESDCSDEDSDSDSDWDYYYGKHFVSCKVKGCSWSGEIYVPPITNSWFYGQGYDVPGDCGCLRDNEDESSTCEHENDVEYVKRFVRCEVNGCSWSGEIYEPLGKHSVYGPFVCVLGFHSPGKCWHQSGNEYEYIVPN